MKRQTRQLRSTTVEKVRMVRMRYERSRSGRIKRRSLDSHWNLKRKSRRRIFTVKTQRYSIEGIKVLCGLCVTCKAKKFDLVATFLTNKSKRTFKLGVNFECLT